MRVVTGSPTINGVESWRIGKFSASLTALSANTVASYSSDLRSFLGMVRPRRHHRSGRGNPGVHSPISRIPDHAHLRSPNDRSESSVDPPVLPLESRHRARVGRPDRWGLSPLRRRASPASARPLRAERPTRSAAPLAQRARVAPTARRRNPRSALRIRPSRQRAVLAHRGVAVARAASCNRLGEGLLRSGGYRSASQLSLR